MGGAGDMTDDWVLQADAFDLLLLSAYLHRESDVIYDAACRNTAPENHSRASYQQ